MWYKMSRESCRNVWKSYTTLDMCNSITILSFTTMSQSRDNIKAINILCAATANFIKMNGVMSFAIKTKTIRNQMCWLNLMVDKWTVTIISLTKASGIALNMQSFIKYRSKRRDSKMTKFSKWKGWGSGCVKFGWEYTFSSRNKCYSC